MNDIQEMPWVERQKLLTDKDRQAIQRAIYSRWEDIDEAWAETDAGRAEIHSICRRKYHAAEFAAGML